MSRKNLFIAATILLLGAYVVFTLLSKSERDDSAQMQGPALLVRPHAPTLGPAGAKVHIVEFIDPACETCRALYPFVKLLMAAHPAKIKLTMRHVPFHEGADIAVQVLEAAKKQDKYWPTLERLLATQGRWAIDHRVVPELVWAQLDDLGLDLQRLQRDMNDPAVGRAIGLDEADAQRLQVRRTPEYFVNGRQMTSFGQEQLRQLIHAELARHYP